MDYTYLVKLAAGYRQPAQQYLGGEDPLDTLRSLRLSKASVPGGRPHQLAASAGMTALMSGYKHGLRRTGQQVRGTYVPGGTG